LAVPASAHDAAPKARVQLAQADVKVKTSRRGHVVKRVVVRHDRGHDGWRNRHRHGHKVVIVKKRPHHTVKKVVIRR
jgi:hypothetical protein